ncbi:MAG: hypothetical protein M0C28_22120, partial [Candidatus Moduliflexus flocculans]|nr:hypothetical protein [Candidatus Moduliflexus flocculans]
MLGDVPLSRRLKSLLETAAEEAHLAGSEYIGTEHLVIASAREGGSVFETLLGRYGVYYEQIRGAVKYLTASREGPPEGGVSLGREARGGARVGSGAARTPLLDEFAGTLPSSSGRTGSTPWSVGSGRYAGWSNPGKADQEQPGADRRARGSKT